MEKSTKKIIKFNGGLGNQMFQYAFACALAHKFNSDIVFDFSYFKDVLENKNVTSRSFELDVFGIDCKVAQAEDFTNVKRLDFSSSLKKTIAKIFPKTFNINYFREKDNHFFNKALFEYSGYIFYEGYFQNEKYFKHIRESLLKSFSLKAQLDEQNRSMLEKIKNTNSVSIHVRRGDYVTLDYVNKINGVCSIEYYQKAIKYIAKKIKNPHFFLFSDDIEWLQENLKPDFDFTIVDFNNNKGYFDLELMKNCKHNIIANSSFSWWGAWLNENSDKIIVAPKKWTNKRQKNRIVPDNWIKL